MMHPGDGTVAVEQTGLRVVAARVAGLLKTQHSNRRAAVARLFSNASTRTAMVN
jgi:hypothetical protein